VQVKPRSSRNQIDGFTESALVVRLSSPPVENAANDALVRLLADWLGVPRSHVQIVAGGRSRVKTVLIGELNEAEIRRRLVPD
jgi:uncharacterized protein (TIGR00251 family)